MANILACTDGSLYAPSVYDHAAWAAQRMGGASIHVLHLLNPHHERPVKTDLSGRMGFGAKTALLNELVELEAATAKIAIKRGQAILDGAVAHLSAKGMTDVVADQWHGKLSDEISKYEREADLVVLGKRGNNADFEKGHLGSNLERVVRSCQHPVLVASREFQPIEHMVIAFDGGASAWKAVQYAANQPLLKDIRCTLLYAGEPNSKIKTELQQAQSQLEESGGEVSMDLRKGDPEDVIDEVVAQDSVDLLLMGAYSHSPIVQLFLGNTTSAMMRKARIPVLLFR